MKKFSLNGTNAGKVWVEKKGLAIEDGSIGF